MTTILTTDARLVSIALIFIGLILGFVSSTDAGFLLLAYVALTTSYSYWLKHVVLIDVMIIAGGFVIRVLAGSYAARLEPSEWLLLCTTFLALFLGFGKRRHELRFSTTSIEAQRPVLEKYTSVILDQLLLVSMVGTLIFYSMYTVFSETSIEHPGLILTVPFAIYGIFRYMLIVHTDEAGGSPEELLLKDRPLQITTVMWGIVALTVIYWERMF